MSEEKNASSVVTSENSADFYAERLGLAEKPVEAVADEPEKEEAEPVETEERSEPTEADAAKPQEERKQNPKLEKRFSEITRQREEARKEAQREREARMQLEDRLRQYEQRQAPQVQDNGKPKPEQFEDAFKYAEALAEYTANLKIQQMKQETEREKFVKTWSEKVNAVKDELPDFDDMVASSDVVVPNHVRDAIMESEQGAKLLYHLAENPEIAEKISKMPAISALREIGKLEARLETKPQASKETVTPVEKSKAPEPIKPIRASKGVVDVPMTSDGRWEGSYQAWKQARKAGKIR